MIRMRFQGVLAGAVLLFGAQALFAAPAGTDSKVDAKADKVLRAMTTYLAGLKAFSANVENSIEVVTADGQKVQFNTSSTVSVQRPNKLFARRVGGIVDQAFYYDGKSLTLYNQDTKNYATVAAPATLDETLDFAAEKLDILAPAADLLDTHAYTRLTEDVTAATYLGVESIAGQRCDHLAYRAGAVDWQVWVREGDKPVPCKYVITSTDIAGAPQFTMEVLKWDSAPKLSDRTFTFVAPAGAKKIEFLPVNPPSNAAKH